MAIGDIVAIHVTGQYLIAGLGLPIFIVTAIALAFRKPALPTPGPMLIHRGRRVLLPWLVWSAFYGGGYALVAAARHDVTLGQLFNGWMILAGPSVHLWFLPFIVVAELAALGLLRASARLPRAVIISAALLLGVAATGLTAEVYQRMAASAPALDHAETVTDPPWRIDAAAFGHTVMKSWLFGLAGVGFGVAVGRSLSLPGPGVTRWVMLPLATLGCVLGWTLTSGAGAWLAWSDEWSWQWWRQTGALVLVLLALQITTRPRQTRKMPRESADARAISTPSNPVAQTSAAGRWLRGAGTLTMGIYLLHPWVHARLRDHLLPRLPDSWFGIDVDGTRPLTYAVLVWTLTAALVLLLRQTPLRRVL